MIYVNFVRPPRYGDRNLKILWRFRHWQIAIFRDSSRLSASSTEYSFFRHIQKMSMSVKALSKHRGSQGGALCNWASCHCEQAVLRSPPSFFATQYWYPSLHDSFSTHFHQTFMSCIRLWVFMSSRSTNHGPTCLPEMVGHIRCPY